MIETPATVTLNWEELTSDQKRAWIRRETRIEIAKAMDRNSSAEQMRILADCYGVSTEFVAGVYWEARRVGLYNG